MKGFGEINQSNKEKIVKIKKKENIDQLLSVFVYGGDGLSFHAYGKF